MNNYLLDSKFLLELDKQENKEVYAHIIALTPDEHPREEIEGRVTGGSVNVDGNSAIRRTCSISLVAEHNDNFIDEAWCYGTKIKIQIGLGNTINNNYPDIIWFDMGLYVITSFNVSKNANSLNISLQGKDKMCLLNGEVGGSFPSSVDLGTLETSYKITETDDKGEEKITYQTLIEKIPIYTIIKNMVKEYGHEKINNIIINDLAENGYELWEYYGDNPMYLFIEPGGLGSGSRVLNMTFNGDTKVDVVGDGNKIALKDLESKDFQFYSMNTLDSNYNKYANQIYWDGYSGPWCHIAKIEYGQTAGYHQTPLNYSSDLIVKAGETVTSVLDKIKKMLGNFEYFYDLQGRFVFQKKNNYIQELFSPIDGELISPTALMTQYSYRFDDESMFTAISCSPNINNIKNDFSVWGSYKGASGKDLAIHARLAIDKKPFRYKTLDWSYNSPSGEEYTESSQIYWAIGQKTGNDGIEVDWRELIYRMAIDFYRHNEEPNFLQQVEANNPYFVDGYTGYEHYYSDIQGFWRELYNPGITEKDQELMELSQHEFYSADVENGTNKYWNKQIHLDPNLLSFWFDFLDTEGALGEYSIKKYNKEQNRYITKMGIRPKVTNETAVKSIYFRETPEVLFIVAPKENFQSINADHAYMPIWIQDSMETLFYRSAQSTSAIDKINELVNQHTAIAETINLTTIPIYYLQPNTRIYVEGYGDYDITKLSYQLTHNGTMTINGTKIFKQFY